jgi:HAD superfamily hydrolase (TIGR01509 family)
MPIKGIIFDCDGTLLDSLGDAMASFNFALDRSGEPARSPEVIKKYFGTSADRILSKIIGSDKKGLLAFEYYKQHQTELAKTMQLHEDIDWLLNHISEQQVPMAIVTGRHAEDLEIVIARHNIRDRFVTLIADSHLQNSKPAPDGILLAAERMGLSPQDTMYVGDSPMDIEASHSAGCFSVAAMWDKLANLEEMKLKQPNFIAQTPNEVWEIFLKLSQSDR